MDGIGNLHDSWRLGAPESWNCGLDGQTHHQDSSNCDEVWRLCEALRGALVRDPNWGPLNYYFESEGRFGTVLRYAIGE
jgi:hypothetical protein